MGFVPRMRFNSLQHSFGVTNNQKDATLSALIIACSMQLAPPALSFIPPNTFASPACGKRCLLIDFCRAAARVIHQDLSHGCGPRRRRNVRDPPSSAIIYYSSAIIRLIRQRTSRP
jgi:hypothetical protein